MGLVHKKLIEQAGLRDIYEKVCDGTRLSAEDGVRLYQCDELPILGFMANIVRERKCGNITYYVRNQHINYTNICNKLISHLFIIP